MTCLSINRPEELSYREGMASSMNSCWDCSSAMWIQGAQPALLKTSPAIFQIIIISPNSNIHDDSHVKVSVVCLKRSFSETTVLFWWNLTKLCHSIQGDIPYREYANHLVTSRETSLNRRFKISLFAVKSPIYQNTYEKFVYRQAIQITGLTERRPSNPNI